MDYQKIRNKIEDGKKIVEQYKDQTPKPVLEVCYSMFEINSLLVDKLEELDNKISKNTKIPRKDDISLISRLLKDERNDNAARNQTTLS